MAISEGVSEGHAVVRVRAQQILLHFLEGLTDANLFPLARIPAGVIAPALAFERKFIRGCSAERRKSRAGSQTKQPKPDWT